MPLKSITSRENPVFQILRGLSEDARTRRKSGQTLLDGEHLLEEALLAGIQPLRLVFAEGSSQEARWLGRLPDVPAIALPEGLFRQLSPVATPSGVLAVIDFPRPAGGAQGLGVLLENIQDPGNLGALLRTAAAAGADAVYLSKGCAEAWSPKALRGGQGAQFRLRIHEQADLVKVASSYPGPVLAAALGAEAALYDLDLTGGTMAFAFGNEGAGLSPGLQEVAKPFTIPMPGGMESLNVAAAAAVCLFERVRQVMARR